MRALGGKVGPSGSAAPPLCATAHPLHTIIANGRVPTGVVLFYIYVTVSPATDHLYGAQGDNGAGSDTAIGAVEALLDTAGELQRSVLLLQVGVINLSHTLIVRKTPSWPRS